MYDGCKCPRIGLNMTAAKLIDDLLAAGLTQGEIARRSGISQSMVSLLRNRHRKDLAYGRARGLVDLHREVLVHGERDEWSA